MHMQVEHLEWAEWITKRSGYKKGAVPTSVGPPLFVYMACG